MSTPYDYPALLVGIEKPVRTAGALIREALGRVQRQDVEIKGPNSLVSFVDREAEKILVEGLGALLPEATFLTEEDTVDNHEGVTRWIIDPLDGTTNFLHGLPVFSVSVALENEGEIIMGVVYDIQHDAYFAAAKGAGATLNGHPISTSGAGRMQDCLVGTGFPYYDFSRMERYFQSMSFFMQHTRGLRRFGSAAIDLAYVACGRFDAYFEYRLQPWDVAAGIILVREAGGMVSDFRGAALPLPFEEVLATNGRMHDSFLLPIQKAFYY